MTPPKIGNGIPSGSVLEIKLPSAALRILTYPPPFVVKITSLERVNGPKLSPMLVGSDETGSLFSQSNAFKSRDQISSQKFIYIVKPPFHVTLQIPEREFFSYTQVDEVVGEEIAYAVFFEPTLPGFPSIGRKILAHEFARSYLIHYPPYPDCITLKLKNKYF